MDQPLSSVLSYGKPIGEGDLDLCGTGVMRSFRFYGPSPEVSNDDDLADCVERLGKAVGLLGTRDTAQVIFDRLEAPQPARIQFEHEAAQMVHDDLRATWHEREHWITPCRLYLYHQFAPPVKSFIESLINASDPKRKGSLAIIRDAALQRFSAFEKAIAGTVTLHRMTTAEDFADKLQCITYDTFAPPPPAPHVSWRKVIGHTRQINGQEPIINGWHLRPVVISQYPGKGTTPQLFKHLLELSGHMTLSIRFECLSSYDAKRALEDERIYWRRGVIGGMFDMFKRLVGMDDEAHQDSYNQLAEIEEAIADCESGTPFGRITTVAIVRDRDPDEANRRANLVIEACHNAMTPAYLETWNAAEAVAGSWPGHMILNQKEYIANARKVLQTGYNFACEVLPASYYHGAKESPLVISGTGHEPFGWPTHVNGIGHQLWLGPTGVGKSFDMWFLAMALLGIPDSRIVALDYGYSSLAAAHLLKAEYHDVGKPGSLAMCPLAMLDQPGGMQWLMGWFKRLFKRWDLELRERQWDDFRSALVTASTGTNWKGEPLRRLEDFRGLIQPGDHDRERIREILQQYCLPPEYGGWGHIFNGVPTANPNQRVTIYEMYNLGSDKQACAPATELILRQVTASLKGNPTTLFVDELHRALSDETAAPELELGLREWRRNNCSFIGATQTTEEIANSPIRRVLIDNMGAMVFLPNHRATNPDTREALYRFGVRDNEIACIASAQPQRELVYKSAEGTRKARIDATPLIQAIVGSSDIANVNLARSLIKDGKLDLNDWLRAKGISGLSQLAAA